MHIRLNFTWTCIRTTREFYRSIWFAWISQGHMFSQTIVLLLDLRLNFKRTYVRTTKVLSLELIRLNFTRTRVLTTRVPLFDLRLNFRRTHVLTTRVLYCPISARFYQTRALTMRILRVPAFFMSTCASSRPHHVCWYWVWAGLA